MNIRHWSKPPNGFAAKGLVIARSCRLRRFREWQIWVVYRLLEKSHIRVLCNTGFEHRSVVAASEHPATVPHLGTVKSDPDCVKTYDSITTLLHRREVVIKRFIGGGGEDRNQA